MKKKRRMQNTECRMKKAAGVVRNTLPAPRCTLNVLPMKRIKRLRNAFSLTASSLEQTNPLRGLTLARAVALMEATLRGEYAIPQWTLWHVEQTDPDLFALESRRTSALMEMDWNIKIADLKSRISGAETKTKVDSKLAAEQAQALLEAYNRLENLNDAIEDMAGAFVRGYSIAQFENPESDSSPASTITHLGVYDPWNIVRKNLKGDFYFNPEGRTVSWRTLGEENKIDPANHLIYTPRKNLMRIALYKFIRMNLSQKDWDAFIEIFGLPSAFIIMPPNVPEEKVASYETAALEAAEGGGGAIPNGSDIKFAIAPAGANPFCDHLKYLQEQLILAGTGGLLTMLSQPTGIGEGASGEHEETFKTIARGEAKKISEVFQKQFDKKVLAAAFPDKPILAYFELAAKEEQDVGEIIKHALELYQAGYLMDASQLSEKTGYNITLNPAGGAGSPGSLLPNPAIAGAQTARLRNSASAGPVLNQAIRGQQSEVSEAVAATLGVRSDLLTPFFAALEEKFADKILTDAELLDAIEAMAKSLPELMTETSVQTIAKIIETTLADALVAEISEATKNDEPGTRNASV